MSNSNKKLITDLAAGLMLAVRATGVLKDADAATLDYAATVLESELEAFCKGEGDYGGVLEGIDSGTVHEGQGIATLVANCVERIALFKVPDR